MTMITSLRIDTAIKPSSYLRTLLYLGLALVMLGLAWLAALALWQYVLILIVTAAVVSYLALSRPVLLHLTQPPIDKRIDQHWQLRIRTSQGDGLWQAQLLAVHHYHWAMSFDFMIKEPYQRSMSLTVFRDQVSLEQWRELNVLANVSAVTTN